MSAAELDLHVETEMRAHRALAGGGARAGRLRPDDAASSRPAADVDLHLAVELLERGCPPKPRSDPRSSVAADAGDPGVTGRIPARAALASIPSPHSGVIDIGPLHIHMYGLMLLLAIAACVGLTGIRWTRLGGDWDLVLRVAVWGVAFGIVGARALPRHHELERGARPWWARSRSGRAASASGAGSSSAASPARSSSAARARACASSPTRSRPAS